MFGGFCLPCGTNALSCSTNWYATGCSAGYWLAGGACSNCTTGANLCLNATAASSCAAGYFGPTNAACTACPANTATCTSLTVAVTCNSGYSPLGTGPVCTACTAPGAAGCTSSVSVPTSCLTASGYYLLTTVTPNQCILCPANATTCSSTTVATACANGY